MRANEIHSESKSQFSDRNRAVLMIVQYLHKWRSTLKSVVFDTSSSLPKLVNDGGGLVCESVGKADLLSEHFDSKQSRAAVDLPLTPIPKGPPSSSVANYRPISITSVLSKVFERLVSVRLGRFMECSGVLPTTQFAYRKSLGTCDMLLCVSHTLQSALQSSQEARIVQIDFSAAFDMVNHQGILYKLCSVVIGCYVCLY